MHRALQKTSYTIKKNILPIGNTNLIIRKEHKTKHSQIDKSTYFWRSDGNMILSRTKNGHWIEPKKKENKATGF
jgi:hypothetical protein